MKNLWIWIVAWWNVRRLRAMMPELKRIRDELNAMPKTSDHFDDIIHFIGVVSKWHERYGRKIGKMSKAFERVPSNKYKWAGIYLGSIQENLAETGYDPDGWNRAKKGEALTENNIFISFGSHAINGGYIIRSITDWKKMEEAGKRFTLWGSCHFPTAIEVASTSARGFISSQIRDMVFSISHLEEFMA